MLMRRRPLLRAAAVGGTAYLAGRNAARHKAEREQFEAGQDERLAALEEQQAPYQQAAPQQPSAPGPGSPMIDQLNQLAGLHQQGVLTDEEFAAAKAKLFGT